MIERWDEAAEAALKDLWARTEPQLSATEIGALLGVTRNAVLGKVNRLKLPMRVTRGQPVHAKPKKRAPRTPDGRFIPTNPILPAHKLPSVDFIGPGRPLSDLPNDACRYAINDEGPFLFCSAPQKDGSSYCEHHHGIVWRPARKADEVSDDERLRRRRQMLNAMREGRISSSYRLQVQLMPA